MKGQYHLAKDDELVVRLDRTEVERLVNEELQSSALGIGALVISELIEEQVNWMCGGRRRRSESRQGHRYGRQKGYIVLGGQKIRMTRPRIRTIDGSREVEVAMYRRLQRLDVIDKTIMRRLIRGISCRNYRGVVGTICESVGLSRSTVSRSFVRQSEERVREFFARRFDGIRFLAIFIDGVQFKRQTMTVAIGVTDDGSKRVLSVRQGATENAQVCVDMLEELRQRGVATDQATLFVLDGSKALRAAVDRVWGEYALVQRCRLHKIRNLRGYVPDRLWPDVLEQLREAYRDENATRAKKRLQTTAKWLDRVAPSAARSLREGLEETMTVTSLHLPKKLARTFMTTNLIESPFARVRSITRRVTHWTKDMRMRWSISSLLEAESRFIRVSGAADISKLAAALDRHRTSNQDMIA